ncbi:MAG: hypothetical protein AABX01_03765 [Candidatus Micrarchaeota archaeon]
MALPEHLVRKIALGRETIRQLEAGQKKTNRITIGGRGRHIHFELSPITAFRDSQTIREPAVMVSSSGFRSTNEKPLMHVDELVKHFGRLHDILGKNYEHSLAVLSELALRRPRKSHIEEVFGVIKLNALTLMAGDRAIKKKDPGAQTSLTQRAHVLLSILNAMAHQRDLTFGKMSEADSDSGGAF